MNIHELVQSLPGIRFEGDDINITSIEHDSRKVQSGSLFVCINGLTVDGHNFVSKAIENGAAAIVAEREVDAPVPVIIVNDSSRALSILADTFFNSPTSSFSLVGVTGTNGKTTVTHLIEKIAKDRGEKTGLLGTMYRKIGEKVLPSTHTTPDVVTLQKTFLQMKEENVTVAAMEVSSHALVQGRVHGCDFDVAVFTNLTQDHLDYHGTMEEYAHAKSLLFSQLGNAYKKPLKYAVINLDDDYAEIMLQATAVPVYTYSLENKRAHFSVSNIQTSNTGTKFTLHSPEGSKRVTIQMVGLFSIYNVLAALAAGYALGYRLEEMIVSLGEVKGVPGRFELVNAGQDFTIIVDYAHTPDSLENVLSTINSFAKQQIITVVGCGGDRDRTKRPKMANVASDLSSKVILTSDNPRTEDPEVILEEMLPGVTKDNASVIVDRKEAIEKAVSLANPGDIVLIAGKGHETYQEINGIRTNFDDREISKEAVVYTQKNN